MADAKTHTVLSQENAFYGEPIVIWDFANPVLFRQLVNIWSGL